MKKFIKSFLALILATAVIFTSLPANIVSAKPHAKDKSWKDWVKEYWAEVKNSDDEDNDEDNDDDYEEYKNRYLVLVGQSNGTYLAYDDIAYVTAHNNVMVKVKPLATALGLTYKSNTWRKKKKSLTLSLDKDKLVFTKNSKTYYFYDFNSTTGQTSTVKLTASYKQSVYESYSSVDCSSLSSLVNYQYFDTTGRLDYLNLGYRGVVVYNRYSGIVTLPDLTVVTNHSNYTPTPIPTLTPTPIPGNPIVTNITVKPELITSTSYSEIKFVEATQTTIQSSNSLLFDLSEVLTAFRANGLPNDGIYGYGSCTSVVTIQALDKNGYHVGEIKTNGSDFLINFPNAIKLKVTGEAKNLMLDFTPVKPIVITDTTKLSFNQINWLYPFDGFARQYFVIADYMRFFPENVSSAFALSRKILDVTNYSDPDNANSYQRITAVFKSPSIELVSPYSYINVQKTKRSINNSLVLFTDTGNAVLATDYETKLLSMITTLTSTGLNTYYPSTNWNRQLIMKLPDNITNTAYSYITLDPSFLNLDYFYDYYIHLHEMTHFYEATQTHYGRRFEAWTEGNATTLAKRTLDAMKITHNDASGKEFFDTIYATNYSFLTQDNKNNFENYYLNSTGQNATLIGYHFTDFLQDMYGSDIVYRIMQKVYAANIPVTAARNSTYDKQFTDCIKAATSPNVFQLFVEYRVN